MDTTFIIEEKIDVLERFVYSTMNIERLRIDDDQKRFLTSAMTDALVRNHEGIESTLSSSDPDSASDTAVRWISKDGTHAISITNSIKELLTEVVNAWPSLLYSLLTKDYWVLLSALLQSIIGVYRRNNRKLTLEQSCVLLHCYKLTAEYNRKIFTEKDIVESNQQVHPTERLDLTEKEVADIIKTLLQEGLLVNVGRAYQIAY